MEESLKRNHPDPKLIDEKDYNTAMAHFYRGELGRIMIWRQRLDTTTNWALLAAYSVITLALGHKEVPHLIFLLCNWMVFLLLIIEGRRYRYYDAYRARVRMLEAHYLAPVVMKKQEALEGDWRSLMVEDLLLPSFKIGVRESVARRLRRNYVWIFVLLFFSWILKVYLHGNPVHGVMDFLTEIQKDQPLSPLLFWLLIIGFYVPVLWLGIYSQKERGASGEMEQRVPSGGQWKI